MSLNEPKRAQKSLNIFKMTLYELKMGLNELKCVALNELKRALMSSNFNKTFTSNAYQFKKYVPIFRAAE